MHTVSGHSALIACKCLRCTHFAWLNASFCELWAERRTAYAVKPECNQGSEICSLLLCIGIISVNLWLKLSFSHVKQFVQVKTCYAHGASRGSNTRCHDKKGCRWAGTCWVHFTGAWLIRPVSRVQGQRCGGEPGPAGSRPIVEARFTQIAQFSLCSLKSTFTGEFSCLIVHETSLH